MNKLHFLLVLLFIVQIRVTYAQPELSKDEVRLKLIDFSDRFKQLTVLSSSHSISQKEFETDFLDLIASKDSTILVNDLPLPNKEFGKISVSQYADLLFNSFKNGLNVVLNLDNISQEQIFDDTNRWHGDILFNKTLSAATNGKYQQLSIKIKVRAALFENEFKILSIDSPYDLDADGVLDENDLCRYQPGLIINLGCPDSDGDGIIDPMDTEPNSKPGKEVNQQGIAKGRFWRDATFSADFTFKNYNFINPEHLSTSDYHFKSHWKSNYLSSAVFVINNPMIYFSNYTIDLNTGIGFTKFRYYFKASEIVNSTSSAVIKYNGFDIPREEGRLNYLTIPLGLKLKNEIFYISLGANLFIKNSSSYREGWVYDLKDNQGELLNKANPQKLNADDDLTESMKNMPVAPFIELGIHLKLFKRFHFKTGVNYTYLNSFNKKSNATAGSTPHFIGLPDTGDLNIHSLNLKAGFIYGLGN